MHGQPAIAALLMRDKRCRHEHSCDRFNSRFETMPKKIPCTSQTPTCPSRHDKDRDQSLTGRSINEIVTAVLAQKPLAQSLFDRLAEGSAGNPGIMRDTYGRGETFAHDLVADHGRSTGLRVRRDAAANTYMTWEGADPSAPAIIIGSHLDSVPHGGNFDGAAGVVAGLVVTAALRELYHRPQCNVTTMAIRAEESVWFEVSYIGSRAALGTLPDGALERPRIDTGRLLADHIAESAGDVAAIRERSRSLDLDAVRAYLELHIEQAPSLVECGVPLAICSGVPGNFRYPNAAILGRHDHVGTPRRFRRDAAMAAAELATALDRLWQEEEQAGVPLAVTFGRFHTDGAVHGLTTVPGTFAFSVDVRAYDEAVLARVEHKMKSIIRDIEERRRVTFDLGRRACAQVGLVDPLITDRMERLAALCGFDHIRLPSPASHDAAAFAEAGVPIGMLLVRNEHGSHNPEEHMEIEDFLKACAVMACWVAQETTPRNV